MNAHSTTPLDGFWDASVTHAHPRRVTHPCPTEEDRMTYESIARGDLVDIVDAATHGLTASTREKLLAVAETTDAVAVGWFHCNGVACPASQANRRNQEFQTAFDMRMAARFGRKWDAKARQPFKPFVVRVVGQGKEKTR